MLKKYTRDQEKERKLLPIHALLPFAHDLRDGMSNNNTSLLRLLLRQARSDKDLETGASLPALLLGGSADSSRHALDASNQNAVGHALQLKLAYLPRPKKKKKK